MRLRNKKWTSSFLEANRNYLVDSTLNQKLNFQTIFNNSHPVCLEIGSGKGDFIITQALKNLNINYLALEKESTVVGVALKKALALAPKNYNLSNLRFLNSYAENLLLIFQPQSLQKIYLNFPDPWPKKRHTRKRLTHQNFLEIYFQLLEAQGTLEFKTDNDLLFNFSLEQIHNSKKWKILKQTTDLYNDSSMLETNVPTEYEKKFYELGKNINKLVIQKWER